MLHNHIYDSACKWLLLYKYVDLKTVIALLIKKQNSDKLWHITNYGGKNLSYFQINEEV